MQEVTIAEAAQLLGISSATVKRRLKAGELNGRQASRPQGFLWMVEVDQDHNSTPPTTGSRDHDSNGNSTGAELASLVTVLQAQVTSQADQVKTLTQQLTVKDNMIAELLIVTRQAQAMLPAPDTARRRWWQFLRF